MTQTTNLSLHQGTSFSPPSTESHTLQELRQPGIASHAQGIALPHNAKQGQCWGCCPWSRGCFQRCLNNLETSILSLPAQIARSSTCPYPLPQCLRIPHQFNFSIKFLQWPQPCLHQLQPRPSFDTISEHTKPA
jgi:hypothetical protein